MTFGLGIVAVPVLIQFALLAGIISMIWTIKTDAADARASRNRICVLNDCLIKMSEFLFLPVVSQNTGSPQKSPHPTRSDAQIMTEIETITRGIESSLDDLHIEPEFTGQVKKIKTVLGEFSTAGNKVLEEVHQAKDHFERNRAIAVLAPTANLFNSEIAALIEMEKAKRAQVAEISSSQKDQIRNWLIYATALSLISAGFMAAFFTYRIKRPLEKITYNLELLAEGKELLPPDPRADELGSLDRLIHTVAVELKAANEQERTLVERAADLITVLDESGEIISVNHMARILLNREPEALKGLSLQNLVIEEESLLVDELIRTTISSNQRQTAELTLVGADGIKLPTRWSLSWSDGEETLFCIAHDITKEKELARMKQEFIGMISHDLRSPLTSVIGGLTMLTSGVKGELPSQMMAEAESAIRSSERLVIFVNTLLDFQRLEEGKFPLEIKEHNLVELMETAITTVRPLADERGIKIELREAEPGQDQQKIFCDGDRLIQVFVNLLSNAIKFSPKDSTIDLDYRLKDSDVKVTMSDCGPGIAEEMQKIIFEPFEQTEAGRNQGTGLGLAICKMIVEAHGGAIAVENRSDRQSGCHFWIELPSRPGGDSS